ncbi:MAG: hypothetical protein GEU73_02365 [Chloroflexi bacterium]|nr:hypothetical protein [Chloroflexota bacterium]
MTDFHSVDDVDVLFARLERIPRPLGLRARVLAAATWRARIRRRVGLLLVASALVLAAAGSFSFGYQLRVSGATALVEAILADLELLKLAPFEVALALTERVPWLLAGLMGVCLIVATLAGRVLLMPMVPGGVGGRERW